MMYITLREFMRRFGWSDEYCQIVGINPWALNEGADPDMIIEIDYDQATKLGIDLDEFDARAK